MTLEEYKNVIKTIKDCKVLQEIRYDKLSELLKENVLYYMSDKEWLQSQLEHTKEMIIVYDKLIKRAKKHIEEMQNDTPEY